MKLQKLHLIICSACIICFTWINMHLKLRVLNEINANRLKYVLLWPTSEHLPFTEMAAGQAAFLRLQCPVTNCFVTANKSFFRDMRGFDFIAFMGRDLHAGYLPQPRSVYQIYIYFNMESSLNYPVEDKKFDGFFNWTSTYRLTSDIPLPYIQIRDKKGNVVGPKKYMEWIPEVPIDYAVLPAGLLNHKSQAAAIFYSVCHSLSEREQFIAELQRELKQHSLGVDVYGSCGPFTCPRINQTICDNILTKKYYFYLSFENSFDEDYVTEKLLTAVHNYVIPVVYGGANYSRFLPPGSYLDGSDMTAMTLVDNMVNLIRSPQRYLQHFWWKKYYTYHDPKVNDNICNICAAMNNEELLKRKKVYKDFSSWWNRNNYPYI